MSSSHVLFYSFRIIFAYQSSLPTTSGYILSGFREIIVYICVLYSFVPNLYSALEGRVGALVQVYAFLLIRLDFHGAGKR